MYSGESNCLSVLLVVGFCDCLCCEAGVVVDVVVVLVAVVEIVVCCMFGDVD